jgi:hypothetical protein
MTAVFDSPTVDVVPAPDHDGCANVQSIFAPRNPSGAAVEDLLEHLMARILTANSWRDLEEGLSQADIAFDLGELDAAQIEILAHQAIEVSRGVPEQ